MTTTASSVGSASPELHTHQCFRNLFASFVGTRNKDIGHKPQPLSGAGLALVFFLAVLALANATPAAAQSTTADVVYGQFGSFTTNALDNGGVSANSLSEPTGAALDSSGNLYVADYNNNRVLFYPPGSTTATRVYGHFGSFTTTTANNGGVSANSLYNPEGVAVDSSGNLYVADSKTTGCCSIHPAARPPRGSTGSSAASPPTPGTTAGSAPTA